MRRVFLMMVALALSACAGDPYAVGELKPYIGADFGFRVDYPSNWDASSDPERLVGVQPGKVHAVAFVREAAQTAFVVFIQQLDAEEALADFAARQVSGMRATAEDAGFSDPAPARLGNLDALATQASVEQGGQALTQRVVLAVRGKRGYAVSLIAPTGSPLNATLDQMLASFSFLP